MKNISLSIIIALFGLLFLNSCIDDDYAAPSIEAPSFEGQANKSIKELKSIYTVQFPKTDDYLKENEFVIVEDDLIIEGYVVSNDKYGNFYKNLVIQGAVDGSKEGINISIGETGLFTKYAVGQKISVKCKGLVLGKYGGEVQLGGGKYEYKSREWRLSPIASPSIANHIFKDADPVAVQDNVKTIDELTDDNLFTLVTLKGVQFITDADQTWANVDGDSNEKFPFKETTVEDVDGNKMTIFTSDYSKFAHQLTPKGSGTITGVLSAHKGTYQFLVSSLDDVDMNAPRLDEKETEFIEVENFDLDFTGLSNFNSLTGWHNIIEKGSREWIVKTFDNTATNTKDYYTQASGYKSKDPELVFWFITPAVNISTQKVFSVSTAKSFWEHTGSKHPVEVLYSSDFDGSNYKTANWQTLNVTIAQNSDENNAWIQSGNVNLPILTGKHISIAFKYTGSSTETTTFRLDNIKVTE